LCLGTSTYKFGSWEEKKKGEGEGEESGWIVYSEFLPDEHGWKLCLLYFGAIRPGSITGCVKEDTNGKFVCLVPSY